MGELNNYYPTPIDMTFLREVGSDVVAVGEGHTWDAYWGRNCTVDVLKGTEVEVNGGYALLKAAGDAASSPASGPPSIDGTATGNAAPGSPFRKVVAVLSNNLVATVLGGLVVAAVVAYLGIR